MQSSERETAPRFLRLVGDSAVFSLGTIAGKIAAVVLLPVVTSRLSPENFGRLDVLSVAVSAVTATLLLGFDVAATRLFPILSQADRKRMFSTWVAMVASVAVVLSVIVTVLAGRISVILLDDPSFEAEIRLLVPIVVGALALHVALGVLRNQNNPWRFAACSGGAIVSSAVLVTWFVLTSANVRSVLVAQGVANTVFGFGSLVVVRRSINARPSWDLLRRLRQIGMPLAPVGAMVALGELLNRGLLLRLSDSAEVGLLSVSVRIGSVLLVVSLAIQTAWHPRAFSLRMASDAERRIGSDIVRLSSLAASAAVGLAVITPATVELVSGADYSGAVLPSGLMIVAALGFSAAQLATVGLLIDSRTAAVTAAVSVGVAVSIVGTVVLGGPWGATGGATALAVGQWSFAGAAWLLGRGGFIPEFAMKSVLPVNALATLFVVLWTVETPRPVIQIAVAVSFFFALTKNGTINDVYKTLTGELPKRIRGLRS